MKRTTQKPATQPAFERRSEERHECTGHILVGRPTKGSILAGAIRNLSIGGCLMKLRAPTDLKPDAIVEIGLHSDNLSFCTLGAIKRHETDSSTIGIEFLNLGLEGRRDLRKLIANVKAARDAEDKVEAEASAAWALKCFCNPTIPSAAEAFAEPIAEPA